MNKRLLIVNTCLIASSIYSADLKQKSTATSPATIAITTPKYTTKRPAPIIIPQYEVQKKSWWWCCCDRRKHS